MNSAKQYMNSAKQCVNGELMWGYCSRQKKKKRAENVDAAKRQETRKPNTHYVLIAHQQGLDVGIRSQDCMWEYVMYICDTVL